MDCPYAHSMEECQEFWDNQRNGKQGRISGKDMAMQEE